MTLITTEEFQTRLGRALDDGMEIGRIDALISDASDRVTDFVGHSFTATAGATFTGSPRRGRWLILDGWPITAVASVTDSDGGALEHTRTVFNDTNGVIELDDPYIGLVTVTYDHGYATVPARVKGVVAQIVGRAFGTPSDRAGITSETTGPYNFQTGAAAAAGTAGMLRDEAATLGRLRRRLPAQLSMSVELVDWMAD